VRRTLLAALTQAGTEVAAVLDRQRANLNQARASKMRGMAVFKTREFTLPADGLCMLLPLDSELPLLKGRKEDARDCALRCKACNEKLTTFVRTLVCAQSLFCPPCAAVLIDNLGHEVFFDCLGAMCHHVSGQLVAKGFSCKHYALDEPTLKMKAAALALFMS